MNWPINLKHGQLFSYSKHCLFCGRMTESLNFSDNKTKLLLLVAVISGFFFMFAANENFLISLLTISTSGDFPDQGVLFFDISDNSCEFYRINQYLPEGRDQILEKNSRDCPFIWEATLKIEKLEKINSSTNNSEINQLLSNASREFDNRNWSGVDRIVDRLEIEREYSVAN